MNYINRHSNRGIVNNFADFVLKEINKDTKYDTVVEVTDCGKFFVINGMTSSSKILDMSDVKERFYKENESLLNKYGYDNINVVDLILYDNELVKKEEYWFTFYNTERPLFNQKMINFVQSDNTVKYNSVSDHKGFMVELDFSHEDTTKLSYFSYSPLNISSEFPYGHSLSMGRLYFYYSEYICNQLFKVINSNKILFKISTLKNQDDDFNIRIISDSMYQEETIKSMVLDVFDFNLNKFQTTILNYDVSEDLNNPISDKPWLIHDRTKDLIIF
jgi:hypothetical protein